MTNVTVSQRQIDPKSGKLITHYGEHSVFTMYVKRHNGRKITVAMSDGNQLKDLLQTYHAYKVYKNDRKYLYHRLVDEPRDQEVKVLMENGKGDMRLERNVTAGRKRIDFKAGELSAIKNIPVTILSELDVFINKGYVINSQVITKTRLISILFAEFLELTEDQKLESLARGDLLLERHKLACGGFTAERVQKEQAHKDITGEDLL
jgi:hypothetical protein